MLSTRAVGIFGLGVAGAWVKEYVTSSEVRVCMRTHAGSCRARGWPARRH